MDWNAINAWILFLLLLNSVYCQESISVNAGEDVLLSCSYDTSSDVFWRYRDGHILFDIIAGKPELSNQDVRFVGRAHTFPELYSQGNFSLVLRNATLTDTGPYECHIPIVNYKQQLELVVTVQPTEETTGGVQPTEETTGGVQPTEETTGGVQPTEETTGERGNGVSMREHCHSTLICIVLLSLSLSTM